MEFGFRYMFANQDAAVTAHRWWKLEVRGEEGTEQ